MVDTLTRNPVREAVRRSSSLRCLWWKRDEFGASRLALFASLQELASGKKVLELGAGCGLMGLAAAKCLAEQKENQLTTRATLTLTDVFPQTLENLRVNCELNGLGQDPQQQGSAPMVSVQFFDFCKIASWPKDEEVR